MGEEGARGKGRGVRRDGEEGKGGRRAGEKQDGEGRGAREDWAGSEQPMDADGQAIKGLWGWVDDRFGAVRAGGFRQRG